ncbi:MAG TPA: lytic transglycosylase domain-containing protein [Streptosporangiaceae bacterium]|nr:lytic transglycosylase domain-containing protein [Streptosporangiaceae bacterium]
MAVAGATTVATIAVASGVAAAAPAGPATRAAPPRPAAGAAVDASDATRQLAREKIHLAVLEQDRLVAEGRQAVRQAARREARRRAAARRAAERAAARQAQQQQPTGNSASAPATPSGSPQQIAAAMLGSFGWSSGEFGCLQSLWNAESGWNPSASNSISGAYGIPQALPGSKMASAGPDWQTNPATQIKWGLGYIKQVYGSPCAAWSHEQSAGWY